MIVMKLEIARFSGVIKVAFYKRHYMTSVRDFLEFKNLKLGFRV